MLKEEFVVEAVHHILRQRSDNILSDCCSTIDRLCDSVPCADTLSTRKTLFSVKLLLNLYEKINSGTVGDETILPADKIFRAIKYLTSESFIDQSCQNEVLSLIGVLCKMRVTCKFARFADLWAAFYDDVFREILGALKRQDYDSERVVFLLKILRTLYSSEYCDKNNLGGNGEVDESLGLALLALHGDESVAREISLFVIPGYVRLFETGAPLRHVWTEFSKSASPNFSRMFLILCNFAGVDELVDGTNLMEFLAGRANYWELLQRGVVARDVTTRKQAMYLFRKTLDVLSKRRGLGHKSTDVFGDWTGCASEGLSNRHWDAKRTNELIQMYSDVVVILEYLNEEQVHIVRPIFDKVEKVVEKTVRCDTMDSSWIFVIYEMALMHESTEVIKWGIRSLLKVPEKVLSEEVAVQKTAALLGGNLNDINLYYSDGVDVTKTLSAFFKKVAQFNTAQLFFKTFVKEMCKLAWSPEALFFVTSSFSDLRHFSFWGPEEIAEIRVFVSKALKTHNKIIRRGIQCELLNAVTGLTYGGTLPLDSVVLLFSRFPESEIFRAESRVRDNVLAYLRNGYSKEDARKTLNLFLNSSQANEECAALSIILFHHAFEEDFASRAFLELLSCFENAYRRTYCDASALDGYLIIINRVVDEYNSFGQHPKLASLVLPFFHHLLLYIHAQVRVVSSPQHFSMCRSYLRTFESLIKLLNVFKRELDCEALFKQLLKSLESDLGCGAELSSVQTYFATSLVKVICESSSYELELVCLDKYLLQRVNGLLSKEENTKDMQMVWGKMNSGFFEAKWAILEILIRKGKIRITADRSEATDCVHNEDLLKMCMDALDVGGYGVLRPVTDVLGRILPRMKNVADLENVVDALWNIILERRKTDEFKFCVERFVKMLFREELFSGKEDVLQVLLKYVDLIFSDTSLVMVDTLVEHVEKVKLTENSMPILCQILAKAMLFGPVQKKEERLSAQVCSYVQFFRSPRKSENTTSCKIRARAAVKLLTIRNEKRVSKRVLDVMMEEEQETSKKRTRYFGNSHIHRMKTRLMQGLLLLLGSVEEKEQKKIAEWVYLSLMTENPQTSVRHLQEWSLSLLHKACFHSFHLFRDAVKKTPKGWCSLMTVAFLLAEASPSDIDDTILEILPLCMEQHFEARLYAEVIIIKLYRLAQELGLVDVVEKWRLVHECIEKSVRRAEGNAAKNYAKLEKHFFFNGFNIKTHYSLQTIYYDLPRLTRVSSDEWIQPELFDSLSKPGATDLGMDLFNKDELFQGLGDQEWLTGKPEEYATSDEVPEEGLSNYQKKMIPMKPLVHGCSGRCGVDDESVEKEGLVVVASLVDRVPNLGGLARTCEVFGASELVLHTMRCMEDKDFKSVSVTAEKWIRVKEVKAESLMEYLVEMKEKGFRVFGAEQAVHSEPLTKTKFPKKCLLVLGNEKKGIPPNLIPLLDTCVEIPQAGIIRSLNVHVTGALFLWEYAKQNLLATENE